MFSLLYLMRMMQYLLTGMGCLQVQYTFLFFLNKNQKKSKLTSLTYSFLVERGRYDLNKIII